MPSEPWEDQVRGSERAARRHQAERVVQRRGLEFDTGSDPLNLALARLSDAWKRGQPLDGDVVEVREAVKEVLVQCGRW